MFAVIVWLALRVVLRARLKDRKIRKEGPPARQMVLEFLISIRSVVIFSSVSMGITLLARAGFYPLPDIARDWGKVWLWTSLALMILAHDAYFYWIHRAMHHPRLFRKFHRRHHRSQNPTPFTAYSFDLREAATMVSFVVLWPLVTPTPWAAVPLFMLHQIVRNTLLHSGYELMPATAEGRPVLDWLTTTTHHDQHHEQAGSNYGLYFTWWDRLMGTENPGYYAAFARSAPQLFPRKPATAAAAPLPAE